MTQHFTAVIELEENGTFSAYVAGVSGVYAAADTAAQARRAIRGALAAHLDALSELGRVAEVRGDVVVLRYDRADRTGRGRLRFVGLGALLGRVRSEAKARAARINGRKGGRPRRAA